VLVVVKLVQRHLPGKGLYLVAALSGLTDVDAITLSMAGYAREGGDARIAVGAIAIAAMTNTLVKCGLVLALGAGTLRPRIALATGLTALAGALAVLAS